jgi:predicted ABC-type ATPase
MPKTKRLRIIAGPNGSGKSTLYDYLIKSHIFNEYYFINADILTRDLMDFLNLAYYPINFVKNEFLDFLEKSTFQNKLSFKLASKLKVDGSVISLTDKKFSEVSYISACLAEFLRHKMILESDSSFAFETVFSHPSKLDEIRFAKENGYKVYLYFIATKSPLVNLERVHGRTNKGGHSVPMEKIKERYIRSLGNAYKAMLLSDKAFFFDNTITEIKSEYSFFAEKKDGTLHIENSGGVPLWFIDALEKKPKHGLYRL